MGDREQFQSQLDAPMQGVSTKRAEPFSEQDEGASFMSMMGQQMPGRAS